MTLVKQNFEALLTLDWEPPQGSVPAVHFSENEASKLQSPLIIGNCEALFERSPNGYAQLKKFEKLLPELVTANPSLKISCHFNAFSYAFLKGAKNYDFLFPESDTSPFLEESAKFRAQLSQLERFEQLGEQFPSELDQETYFAIRSIFTRGSAREEKWVLAELLVSGPATIGSLVAVLSSYQSPIQRAVNHYHSLGILTVDTNLACLSREHLPLVYFFVRETMGIDPLELLS